jgi:hypothetical protein
MGHKGPREEFHGHERNLMATFKQPVASSHRGPSFAVATLRCHACGRLTAVALNQHVCAR